MEQQSYQCCPIARPALLRRPTSEQRARCQVVSINRVALHVRAQDAVIQLGERIEVAFEWPAPLYGRVPLQLIAAGKVIWVDAGGGFVVEVSKREFRTLNKGPHIPERLP